MADLQMFMIRCAPSENPIDPSHHRPRLVDPGNRASQAVGKEAVGLRARNKPLTFSHSKALVSSDQDED